jgi:hypothetical protein
MNTKTELDLYVFALLITQKHIITFILKKSLSVQRCTISAVFRIIQANRSEMNSTKQISNNQQEHAKSKIVKLNPPSSRQ